MSFLEHLNYRERVYLSLADRRRTFDDGYGVEGFGGQPNAASGPTPAPAFLSQLLRADSGVFAASGMTGAVADGGTVGGWQGTGGLSAVHADNDPVYAANSPCGQALYFTGAALVDNLTHNLELLGISNVDYHKCQADWFELVVFCPDKDHELNGQFNKLISHSSDWSDWNAGFHTVNYNGDLRRAGESPTVIPALRATGRRVGVVRFKSATNTLSVWVEGVKQYDIAITPLVNATIYRHFLSGIPIYGALPMGAHFQAFGRGDYAPTDAECLALSQWAQQQLPFTGNIFLCLGNSNDAFTNPYATGGNWFQLTMQTLADPVATPSWGKPVHSRNLAISSQTFADIVSGNGAFPQSIGLAAGAANCVIPGRKTFAWLDEWLNTWHAYDAAGSIAQMKLCAQAILNLGVTELVITNGESCNPTLMDPTSSGEDKPGIVRDWMRAEFPNAVPGMPGFYTASSLTWADAAKVVMFDQWTVTGAADYTNTTYFQADGIHRTDTLMQNISTKALPYYQNRVAA